MGIKGKRKRERARAELEARQAESSLAGEVDGEVDGSSGDEDMFPIKKTDLYNMRDMEYLESIREEHANRRKSHLGTPSRYPKGADGAVSLAEKLASLDKAELMRQLPLQHNFDHEDALNAITGVAKATSAPLSGKRDASAMKSRKVESVESRGTLSSGDVAGVVPARRSAATGARFDHPLIGLHRLLQKALCEEGFTRMTRIQERVIPLALDGYDILGQARTGSGKTLAFCTPILHSLLVHVDKEGNIAESEKAAAIKYTYALMVAPTKELCVQIHAVLEGLCKRIPTYSAAITVQLITGGTKVIDERRRLVNGVSLVVGTPGRIHDHVKNCRGWDCSRVKYFVLDEADRMLADGFQKDLDAILRFLPRSRQTYLFSATNSKSVKDLARLSLSRTPIFVATTGSAPQPVGDVASVSAISTAALAPYRAFEDPDDDDVSGGSESEQDHGGTLAHEGDSTGAADGEAIPSTLRQFCHIVPLEDRLIALYVFMKRVARVSKAMVFCSTVASATFHCQMMGSIGFHNDVIMLHGHMKHRQRLAAFQCFLEWETGVLFCTDVAARGLDIPNVEWILQYDPPLDPTEYIHRIGRTARAGNVGNALLFLAPEEATFVQYLLDFGIALEAYPMPSKLPDIQLKLQDVLQLDPIVAKSAVMAFRASVGAYQSHVLKDIFEIHRLSLDRLATGFALTSAPHITLPKVSGTDDKNEYVKGKLKSLNRQKKNALLHYEANKTRPQWEDGRFVGVVRPK